MRKIVELIDETIEVMNCCFEEKSLIPNKSQQQNNVNILELFSSGFVTKVRYLQFQ